MISPQSISVATGATGMVGHEGDIFRFTLKHSIILVCVIGVMAMLQAYVFTWMVPVYAKAVAVVPGAAPAVAAAVTAIKPPAINPDGLMWLAIFVGASLLVTILSRVLGKNIETKGGKAETHFH